MTTLKYFQKFLAINNFQIIQFLKTTSINYQNSYLHMQKNNNFLFNPQRLDAIISCVRLLNLEKLNSQLPGRF